MHICQLFNSTTAHFFFARNIILRLYFSIHHTCKWHLYSKHNSISKQFIRKKRTLNITQNDQINEIVQFDMKKFLAEWKSCLKSGKKIRKNILSIYFDSNAQWFVFVLLHCSLFFTTIFLHSLHFGKIQTLAVF